MGLPTYTRVEVDLQTITADFADKVATLYTVPAGKVARIEDLQELRLEWEVDNQDAVAKKIFGQLIVDRSATLYELLNITGSVPAQIAAGVLLDAQSDDAHPWNMFRKDTVNLEIVKSNISPYIGATANQVTISDKIVSASNPDNKNRSRFKTPIYLDENEILKVRVSVDTVSNFVAHARLLFNALIILEDKS